MNVQKLMIEDNASILIIAPHPDDETIGTGGVLSKYASQCDVLVLTDGRKGVSPLVQRSEEELIALRKKEFEEASHHWMIRSHSYLDIPDRKVARYKKRIRSLDFTKYDYIFLPYRHDDHPDHKAVYKMVKRILKSQNENAKLLEYEVWTPLREATFFLDISNTIDRKISNIKLYHSQLESYDYEKLCRGLAGYRGALYGCGFCEAYYCHSEAKKQYKLQRKEQIYHNMVVLFWQRLPLNYKNKIRWILGRRGE